jgi:D-alanyl-lipoteichoic acid acyltransferase DltB (MBOAT superfamily)
MSFTSPEFVFLVIGTLVVYGIVPKQWRWAVLLAASYFFYALWNSEYLWVLALVTAGTYWAAQRIERSDEPRIKTMWLVFGLVLLLGLLGVFKYYDYLVLVVNSFRQEARPLPLLDRAAPIGIAFFSLQVIAYLVDVSRGQTEAANHLGHYALFVAFFPQLVAGPITRAQQLLPQIKFLLPVLPEELRAGFHRLLIGAFQKFVVADRLANFTNPIFQDPQAYSSLALLANLYLYAVQIYADFAGYSNIAIGIAKLFGVDLAENFRQPYLALDVADFWNRWHISLSNWLRDYIFYPTMRFMRGQLKTSPRWLMVWLPPLVTMLVSGVWHGVGPQFVVWGLLHGVMLALAASTARWRKSIAERLGKFAWAFKLLQWLVTFNFLVFSWAFFRLPGVRTSLSYLRQIAAGHSAGIEIDPIAILVAVVVLIVFLLFERLTYSDATLSTLKKTPLLVRWGVYYFFIFLILFMGNFEGSQPFIYEQF